MISGIGAYGGRTNCVLGVDLSRGPERSSSAEKSKSITTCCNAPMQVILDGNRNQLEAPTDGVAILMSRPSIIFEGYDI